MSGLRLTLDQPAQIGDRPRSDQVLATVRHVPGPVVRGALAASWIAEHGAPTGSRRRREFVDLFEGGVRFGPLFSGQPIPSLAVLAHKYPAGPACTHDDLDEVEYPDAPSACPDCGSPWAARKDLPDEDGVVVRRRTSVVIGSTGVADRGGLYTRDTLTPVRSDGSALVLTGHLVAQDPALLDCIGQLETVRIGGRRTTHGLARVEVDPAGDPTPPQVLPDGRVVLRLRSPGVFVDTTGRPTAIPGQHLLARFLGPGCVVERSWYRWQTVGGWHVASGLPKPVELAVAAGSTYVVRPGRPVAEVDLTRLARHGLGLRRHEGFGDLGGAPALRPGRDARQAETRRVEALLAPVRRAMQVSRNPEVVDRVRTLLLGHAAADATSTERLRALVEKIPDPGVGQDLQRLMGYAPDDIRTVIGQWR